MAIHNSPPIRIRISEFITEFNGNTPFRLSNYYKNGAYVPSVVSSSVSTQNIGSASWTDSNNGGNGDTGIQTISNIYNYFLGGYIPSQLSLTASINQGNAYINNVHVGTAGNNNSASFTYNATISNSNNGSITFRGTQNGGAGTISIQLNQVTYNYSINFNVPTSGIIKLSNFYGATKA